MRIATVATAAANAKLNEEHEREYREAGNFTNNNNKLIYDILFAFFVTEEETCSNRLRDAF